MAKDKKNKEIKDSLKHIVSLCKRRGFIYHGSDIYGGFANTYSYGPYGTELKRNIKNLWWSEFVSKRTDMVGIDGPILLHPHAWRASGHLEGFNDALIDCKDCKARYRADQFIEDVLDIDADGKSCEELTKIINDNDLKCPKCGSKNFTDARNFNLMFKTHMSKTTSCDTSDSSDDDAAYLRPETAQAIFLEYKNVVDTTRVKIPFGIAQIGKAFRNEITPGNFIFRTIEFEQMEIEYFIHESIWQEQFNKWLHSMRKWCDLIGLKNDNLHEKEHEKEKLSHYSKRTVDIVYDFPFGRSELYGLAYRTDFDLSAHQKSSGVKQEYFDQPTNTRFIPHVIEPTFGVDRTILALLCDAYEEEKLENNETRTVLHLSPKIAPVKVAVFPLMKKDQLKPLAKEIFNNLKLKYATEYDETGAIGKRYRRQDELGTPLCITVDYDTLEDDCVTIRDRDTMQQQRVKIENIEKFIEERIG
jgi:glycyl-tRNA synthetase